jgi:hypothetical protein
MRATLGMGNKLLFYCLSIKLMGIPGTQSPEPDIFKNRACYNVLGCLQVFDLPARKHKDCRMTLQSAGKRLCALDSEIDSVVFDPGIWSIEGFR